MRPQMPILVAAALGLHACIDESSDDVGSDVGVADGGDEAELAEHPVQAAQVDILWVIDNSSSMLGLQQLLARDFDSLVTELAGFDADVRVGVITTDLVAQGQAGVLQRGPGNHPAQDCLSPPPELSAACATLPESAPYLSTTDFTAADGMVDVASMQEAFRCIASAGTCGAYFESGIAAMLRAVSPEALAGPNAGFVRDDAILAVMFVSDEDDCSAISTFTPSAEADCYVAETRDQLIDTAGAWAQLVALKGGVEERVVIGGIIGPADTRYPGPSPRDEYAQRELGSDLFSCSRTIDGGGTVSGRDGLRYRELIQVSGDTENEASICGEEFRDALIVLADAVRSRVNRYCLPDASLPATCDLDSDCAGELACINPGDPAVGEAYCETFEIFVSLRRGGPAAAFEDLDGPGPIGSVGAPGSDFIVDYDSDDCASGIAFSFGPGVGPEPGSAYRIGFDGDVPEVVADTPDAGVPDAF